MKRSFFLSSYSVTLGVGHDIAAVHLHEIGFDEKPRFAAAGAADHQHIFVAGVGGILGAAIQHQPFALGENDVIFLLGVHVGCNIFPGAP